MIDFLAPHHFTFRGIIDVFESEDEGGNGLFLSLFNYTVEKDESFRAIIKTISRNATYTRPDMQNELIAAISSLPRVLNKKLEILGIQSKLMATRTQLV